MVDHKQRPIRLAAVRLAVKVLNSLEGVRGFLNKSEPIVVPRYVPSVVFGHHDHPSARIDHLMQRGPWLIESLSVEIFH